MQPDECAINDCHRRPLARGLCDSHYQKARLAGTLDEIAPRPQTPCRNCGEVIPSTRRWGSLFCSTKCKQAHTDATLREETVRARAARTTLCGWCREPLPLERRANARFCSRRCLDAAGNRRKQRIAENAKRALRQPCEMCGDAIPMSRPSNAVYCSLACKGLAGNIIAPKARFRANLIAKYGLTMEAYEAMLAAQGGACAICRRTEPTGKGWHIDHCHTTNRVRAILCHHCNLMLGHALDEPALLRAAANYLEAHSTS
jgi:hypothetical protein